MEPDCTQPEFWDERYRAGRMAWDNHAVPPALTDYLRRAAAPGAALVPGCGSGYEVQAFAERGWQVTAVDFAPAAVARAAAVLGPLASCVRRRDFFADDLGGPFDLVYERTFVCSFPSERWPEYARRVAGLLAPGGRLAGVFIYGSEPEPPPFPFGDVAEARRLFAEFELVEDVAIRPEQSLPLYAGMERWQVWRKTGAG